MKDHIGKLLKAKGYIASLAKGIDPVTNEKINGDTFYREQIISCLEYVSNVLDNCSKSVLYFTDEQISHMKTEDVCTISDIILEINRIASENDLQTLDAGIINKWLELEGYLEMNELNCLFATKKGMQIGISSAQQVTEDGTCEYTNFYNRQAQGFIYKYINEILYCTKLYRKKQIQLKDIQHHNIIVKPNLTIKEFIKQNYDKCFIISAGHCNTFLQVGGYDVVLYYKGKCKKLQNTNINTNSANYCILQGVKAAAKVIKSPVSVVIVTSTSLGFNSPKSKHKAECNDIEKILHDKKCDISIASCIGKGEEINSFIDSIVDNIKN